MLTSASGCEWLHKIDGTRVLSSPGLMETIDPDSISAELLERDDETEAVQVVPPVVAVMRSDDGC